MQAIRWPMPLRSSRRWRPCLVLACRLESAEHLHRQAVGPAQKYRALDPQRARTGRLVLGWQDPPQLRSQRRGYRVLQFTADRPELPLQPGHALRWQAGAIYLLMSPVQQRPDAQKPAWRLYPAGRAAAGALADYDSEPPHRRRNVVLRLPSAWGIVPVHRTRLRPAAAASQGRSSRVGTARSRPAAADAQHQSEQLSGITSPWPWLAVRAVAACGSPGPSGGSGAATKVPWCGAGGPCGPRWHSLDSDCK